MAKIQMTHRFLGIATGAVLMVSVAAAPAQAMTNGVPVTDPNTAPWVATLAIKGTGPLLQLAGCGGALITPDRVLTAAHCVDQADPSQLQVHVNARVLSADPGQVRDIRGISVLPGYQILPSPVDPTNIDDSSGKNDLAVILLDRPVRGVPLLHIAAERPVPGTPVSMFSHGTTGKAGTGFRDDVLHRGDLTVIPHQDCQAQTPATVDEHSVTCTQDFSGGGVTMCFQDSGSPVVRYRDGKPELIGVASFGGETAGKPCGAPAPLAFADPTVFRPWIYQLFPSLEPYPAHPATISGMASVSGTLHCTPPVWDLRRGGHPKTVTFGWATVQTVGPFTIPHPIAGKVDPDLQLDTTLAGKQVACQVTASNTSGTVSVLSPPVTI